jgi:hypothetical protein
MSRRNLKRRSQPNRWKIELAIQRFENLWSKPEFLNDLYQTMQVESQVWPKPNNPHHLQT